MHPICSWMVTIDLYDELELTRLEPDRLSRYAILWHGDAKRPTEIDWSVRNDLAVRAHLALEKHTGRHLPVQLRMDKRIPVGGGLGGGSSDAAAMLHAVNDLFDLGLSADELAAIGSGLGSDVPYFVHGGSAIVEGLGDRVTRHDSVPEVHAVLIFPEHSCSTGAVYRQFDAMGAAKLQPAAVQQLAQTVHSPIHGKRLFNDLTEAALAVAPALREVCGRIEELAERPAHLSGSGSTWFILCDDPLHAEHLAEAVESRLGLPALAVRSDSGQSHHGLNPR
jgi:4-diphosphocytidyl-2-C-methyl-D-erythritol kinase